MHGYVVIREEKDLQEESCFWELYSKFLNLENLRKVTYKLPKRENLIIHRIIRNSKTRKFSPMFIKVCVQGSIKENICAIIRIPILDVYKKIPMEYYLKKHCWKISMDLDINNSTSLLETDDRIMMFISTI